MQTRTPDQVPQLFARAVDLHRQGHLQAARSLYERIVDLQPRHFDALHVLGVLAAQSGDYQRAERFLRRAVEADPNHASAHNNRGNVLKALGQPNAAVASYDQAIAIAPAHAEARTADNHLVELAVAGGANHIVTRNVRDLRAQQLKFPGLSVMTPGQFLKEVTG